MDARKLVIAVFIVFNGCFLVPESVPRLNSIKGSDVLIQLGPVVANSWLAGAAASREKPEKSVLDYEDFGLWYMNLMIHPSVAILPEKNYTRASFGNCLEFASDSVRWATFVQIYNARKKNNTVTRDDYFVSSLAAPAWADFGCGLNETGPFLGLEGI